MTRHDTQPEVDMENMLPQPASRPLTPAALRRCPTGRALAGAWVLTACATLLSTTLASASEGEIIISCPIETPYFMPSPDYCGIAWDFQVVWNPGLCGCDGRLYRVDCGGPAIAGVTVDGQPGCMVGPCAYSQTTSPCAGDVEIPGTPPGPRPQCDECPPVSAGNPVSLTTGEMFFTHLDATVGELTFSRTYNSNRLNRDTRYGSFGRGWNSGLEPRLRFGSATVIEARDVEGQPVYYTDKDADGRFEQELPYGHDTWVQEAAGLYFLNYRSGAFETYLGGSGYILSSTDTAGVITTYTRDSQGRVTDITRRGRSLGFAYEGTSARPSQLLGPNGAVLATYAYDGSGRLETVSYPDGTGYRYGYDSGSRILWVKNALGEPIESHEYDAEGRAITSEIGDGQDKLTFAYVGNLTTVTDARGNASVYEWTEVRKSYRVTKVTGVKSLFVCRSALRAQGVGAPHGDPHAATTFSSGLSSDMSR
jgi:YD repeat-containing protein